MHLELTDALVSLCHAPPFSNVHTMMIFTSMHKDDVKMNHLMFVMHSDVVVMSTVGKPTSK